MIEQRVEHRSLRGWRGIVLILAVAAAAGLGSALLTALEGAIGRASSVLFILYGCGIAWWLLQRYVLAFVYTCGNGCLRVCRAYGKRERLMLDVWLNNIRACGSPEAMRKRFPNARVQRAVKRECPLEQLAIAHVDGGKMALLILQPDQPLREVIVRAAKH